MTAESDPSSPWFVTAAGGQSASYQPLELQGEQGAEEEHGPDHGTDDEAEPEDARLCFSGGHVVWRGLWGTAAVLSQATTCFCVFTAYCCRVSFAEDLCRAGSGLAHTELREPV